MTLTLHRDGFAMMLFWLFALVLALLVAVYLVLPFIRYHEKSETSLLELNRQVFRERLAELEKDEAEGRLDAAGVAELKTELQRSLLSLEVAPQSESAKKRIPRWLLVLVLMSLPVFALAIYKYAVASAELPEWWELRTEMGPTVDRLMKGDIPGENESNNHTIADFIRVLQDRLQRNPDNAEGWFMLGMSYVQLNLPQPARVAFEHAWRQEPDKVPFQISYAQARIHENEGRLDRTSHEILLDVLTKAPTHEGALLLLGLSAYRSGDYAISVSALEKLQSLRLARGQVSGNLTQVDEALTAAREALQRADHDNEAQSDVLISARVRVDRGLLNQYSPNDTVYVFARALQGPPMPLAVVKRKAGELPFTVDLSDANGVMPTLKLSQVGEVAVSARISRHGGPEARTGDFEAVAVPVRLGGKQQNVELIINSPSKEPLKN